MTSRSVSTVSRIPLMILIESPGDDQNLRNLQESRIKNLGIITIEVFRYKLISITLKGERYAPIDSGAGPVPEKALKGRAVTLAAGLVFHVLRPHPS